ncbi:hypothetical protein E3P92_02504 [Wallemia ichthyophaga]|nr:hypothetical protein E3P92_02504 [Wallemia ichthyophaga]
MEERCILLNPDDSIAGDVSKKECHLMSNIEKGMLHRAFSTFLFRESDGRLLMQKRAQEKITFPGLWTNTCCSHPLSVVSEMDGVLGGKRAAVRKLDHELGINQINVDDLDFLTKIHYLAPSDGLWGEHEIDYIYFVKKDVSVEVNENEVSDIRWVSVDELKEMLSDGYSQFTPWFRIIVENFLFKWWEKGAEASQDAGLTGGDLDIRGDSDGDTHTQTTAPTHPAISTTTATHSLSSVSSTPPPDFSSSPRTIPIRRNNRLLRNYQLSPANLRFCCSGHIVTSKDNPIPFICSIFLVLAIPAVFFGRIGVDLWYTLSPAVPIIAAYLTLLVWCSMFKTAFADPGVLPVDIDKNAVDTFPRDVSLRHTHFLSLKYCETCHIYRPPRASHCRLCNSCVDGIDHHCSFLNICIGRRNYPSFLTFCGLTVVTLAYYTAFAAVHLYQLTQDTRVSTSQSFGGALRQDPASAVVFVVAILFLIPLAFLLAYHARLTLINSTTIEQLREKAVDRARKDGELGGGGENPFVGDDSNPFSLGPVANVQWMAFRPGSNYSHARFSAVAQRDARRGGGGYTPLALVDDYVNHFNEPVGGIMDAIEDFFVALLAEQGLDLDGDGRVQGEVRAGIHRLQTLLEHLIDKNVDKLEIYLLRNILTLPSELACVPTAFLPHYRELDLEAAGQGADDHDSDTNALEISLDGKRGELARLEKINRRLRAVERGKKRTVDRSLAQSTHRKALLAQLASVADRHVTLAANVRSMHSSHLLLKDAEPFGVVLGGAQDPQDSQHSSHPWQSGRIGYLNWQTSRLVSDEGVGFVKGQLEHVAAVGDLQRLLARVLSIVMTPTPTPTRKRKAPPGPLYVVRSHEHSVTQVSLAPTAHHLVSGDDGGGVCITSLRTMRCVRQWAAHSDSVLTLQWLDNYTLLSHGRDNLVKVWSVSGACGDSDDNNDNNDSDDTYTPPPLTHEFHVNALNFCNVSACTVQTQTHAQTQAQTLWVAAPHLADSARIDVWELPSTKRVHRSIGVGEISHFHYPDGRGEAKTGLCMALEMYEYSQCRQHEQEQEHTPSLRLLAAYEDGSLVLFELGHSRWIQLWRVRLHNEAIMDLCVTSDKRYAYTVSVDRCVAKYDLRDGRDVQDVQRVPKVQHKQSTSEIPLATPLTHSYTTKSNGHSSISVRMDGRVLAVGCWNGSVELYSTKSMKLVGVLDMHRQSVSALTFSTVNSRDILDDGIIEAPLNALLVTGGRDERVAIYEIDL